MLKLMLLQVKTNVAQMRGGAAAWPEPLESPRNLRSHSPRVKDLQIRALMALIIGFCHPARHTSGFLARFDGLAVQVSNSTHFCRLKKQHMCYKICGYIEVQFLREISIF